MIGSILALIASVLPSVFSLEGVSLELVLGLQLTFNFVLVAMFLYALQVNRKQKQTCTLLDQHLHSLTAHRLYTEVEDDEGAVPAATDPAVLRAEMRELRKLTNAVLKLVLTNLVDPTDLPTPTLVVPAQAAAPASPPKSPPKTPCVPNAPATAADQPALIKDEAPAIPSSSSNQPPLINSNSTTVKVNVDAPAAAPSSQLPRPVTMPRQFVPARPFVQMPPPAPLSLPLASNGTAPTPRPRPTVSRPQAKPIVAAPCNPFDTVNPSGKGAAASTTPVDVTNVGNNAPVAPIA